MSVIDCPSCKRRLQLPGWAEGREVQCPSCDSCFAAPQSVPSLLQLPSLLEGEYEQLNVGKAEATEPSARLPSEQLSMIPGRLRKILRRGTITIIASLSIFVLGLSAAVLMESLGLTGPAGLVTFLSMVISVAILAIEHYRKM